MTDTVYCSFCGESNHDLGASKAMVQHPHTLFAICEDCVAVCTKVIDEWKNRPAPASWPYGSMGEYLD